MGHRAAKLMAEPERARRTGARSARQLVDTRGPHSIPELESPADPQLTNQPGFTHPKEAMAVTTKLRQLGRWPMTTLIQGPKVLKQWGCKQGVEPNLRKSSG